MASAPLARTSEPERLSTLTSVAAIAVASAVVLALRRAASVSGRCVTWTSAALSAARPREIWPCLNWKETLTEPSAGWTSTRAPSEPRVTKATSYMSVFFSLCCLPSAAAPLRASR